MTLYAVRGTLYEKKYLWKQKSSMRESFLYGMMFFLFCGFFECLIQLDDKDKGERHEEHLEPALRALRQ